MILASKPDGNRGNMAVQKIDLGHGGMTALLFGNVNRAGCGLAISGRRKTALYEYRDSRIKVVDLKMEPATAIILLAGVKKKIANRLSKPGSRRGTLRFS